MSQEAQSVGYNGKSAYQLRINLQEGRIGGGAGGAGGGKRGGVDGGEGSSWGDSDSDGGDEWETGEDNDTQFITGRQKGIDVVKELKNLCLEHDEKASLKNLAIELNR